MALEAKKERDDERAALWETALTRRLADDLDAFLEKSDDATFLFAAETIASRRESRSGKRPRFKALATVAASLALFLGVAAAVRFYTASPETKGVAETRQTSDEQSLIAWSVESLSETEWARRVETRWASADVFELYSSLGTEDETAEETRLVAEKNERDEAEGTVETASNEWFSVEKLADVAALEPLKYEPFLQTIAATLL